MFGILNLDKPSGWTSRDVVNRVAKLVRPAKAGHAGTLDPLATGTLIVCVGPATRLVPLIHDHAKTYEATFLLGRSSPTDDVAGDVREVDVPQPILASDVERLLPEFQGEIEQVPPAYSAVHVGGERAYRRARRGEALDIPPRRVLVHSLTLTAFRFPELSLRIDCGTGVYVRSIGRDIGQRLGTSAILSELRRTRIGPLTADRGRTLDELTRDNLHGALESPLVLLEHLPRATLSASELEKLTNGQSLPLPKALRGAEQISIVDAAGNLRAIGGEKQGRLAPRIVLPAVTR